MKRPMLLYGLGTLKVTSLELDWCMRKIFLLTEALSREVGD